MSAGRGGRWRCPATPRTRRTGEGRQAGRQAGEEEGEVRSVTRKRPEKRGSHTSSAPRPAAPAQESPSTSSKRKEREEERNAIAPGEHGAHRPRRAAPRLCPRPQAGQARACSSALAPPIHPTNLIIPSSLPPSISHLSHARARRGPRGGLAGRWQVHRALACMWQQLHEHAPHPRPVPHGQKGTPERAEA